MKMNVEVKKGRERPKKIWTDGNEWYEGSWGKERYLVKMYKDIELHFMSVNPM